MSVYGDYIPGTKTDKIASSPQLLAVGEDQKITYAVDFNTPVG